jgi:peroxiredoxin Q/BCP
MKYVLLALVVTMVLVFLRGTAKADPIAVGADAPKPAATDENGVAIDWDKVFGKGFVLVYFYPKADTPGCTAQACSLRDKFAELTEKGVKVFGVSVDKPEAQQAFKKKYNLPFTLIPDDKGVVVAAYGVPKLPVVGMAKRQAFLFKDGKLAWRSLSASTTEQAADVLAEIAREK